MKLLRKLLGRDTSTAPQNVRVRVVCYDQFGSEHVRYWDFIGSGSGSLSPMHAWMEGKTIIIDGGCGTGNGTVFIGP